MLQPVQMTYRESVKAAIEDEMAADPTVILMGEDVAAAGGVFKTSEGLVEKFGLDRVRDTPICENTFVSVALGMAVTGMRPIVEIMFSDFLPMASDAIVNEAAKFRFMSGGQCSVPLTIRSIGGAMGRFGTQHSATGESWFLQSPGLKIATASSPGLAYGNLRAAIRDNNPVLFFEHKALYGRKGPVIRADDSVPKAGKASIVRSGSDLTIVATLLMADQALVAAEQLMAEGIDAEVVDPVWLRPMDMGTIESSVRKTGRLLVVEEQVHSAGWGATLLSELSRAGMGWKASPRALSISDLVLIPYSPSLEDAVIPSADSIATSARDLISA